ncbi:GNAT family N-acetyltransferase [Terribacillus halophilus]|uniref:GNAT family N-acetyltransferase n=1 Tax=Terribacillus halophilus TaxID=361279 RepID=UPI0009866C58|nr:GNAT family N-acetyltransferase [Terribacillus halophilus]
MIKIRKIKPSEEKFLHHLMQFYIYEFSSYISDIKLEEDGTFKPFDLRSYWNSEIHHAFFIYLDTELIGFALIESNQQENTVREFFILAGYQGKGYGKTAARRLFETFDGYWNISQIEKNRPAQAFWRGLILDITKGEMGERFESNKYIQRFHTSSL